MKKLIASATVAGLVVLGGGAVAAAAPREPKPDASAQSQGARAHRRAVARGALAVAADTIGISTAGLRSELQDGKTVAQVAEAHGVEAAKVVDAIVAKATARIDTAVADGKIDAERAATLKDKLPDAATKLVNHSFEGQGRRRHARRGAVRIAADTIGVKAGDLVREVRDGKTIAQVAEAHDVAPQAVIDAVVAKAQERVDAAVAKGTIDADRGQQIVERVTQRVTKLVNETPHRGD